MSAQEAGRLVILVLLPDDDGPECEEESAADCGSAASCAPNPCVASPSGAFLN